MARTVDLDRVMADVAVAVDKNFPDAHNAIADTDLVAVSNWASTGSLALDRAIAGRIPGGIPMGPKRGRVVHIYGEKSLGKSVLLDMIFLSTQRMGGLCNVSETEGSRERHFAEAIGVNLRRLNVQRPPTIEMLIDAWLDWEAKTRARVGPDVPLLGGLDSLELVEGKRTYGIKMSGKEGGVHEFGGGRAAAIGAGCRNVAHICATGRTSWVILNQVRESVGVMFGNPKKPGGGKAVPFFASVEIELKSSKYGRISDDRGRAAGIWVHARVVKNKVAPPFAECEFLIRFDTGVQKWAGVLETLEAEGRVGVKRNKDLTLASNEFTDLKTGEVLPLPQFTKWCMESKVLES